MGVPSIGILLHEVIKLMYHAKCKDPTFFRIGTCGELMRESGQLFPRLLNSSIKLKIAPGGIGIDGGTVVVSNEGVDGCLKNTYEVVSF
jgi:uridine phosphorylase